MPPSLPTAVVLDTNVVLDWIVFGNPEIDPVTAALARGDCRWIATAAMLDELQQVLARPLPARWELRRLDAIAIDLRPRCTIVDPAPRAPQAAICSDPADQKFIDLALAWRAPWLLTRDRALLRLAGAARAGGVSVVPPARWLPV